MPIHHNLRLHKNFLHSASQSNSGWPRSEPCFWKTTKSSNFNSTEHSSLQKGSVQCNVGAGNIGCLLSAVCCGGSVNTLERDNLANLPCQAIYRNCSLLKLNIEPTSLLLEDPRSKASCERNIKATILSIELVLYTFYLLIHAKLKCTFKEEKSSLIKIKQFLLWLFFYCRRSQGW